MKLTWRSHSAFRIEAGAAKIVIDPFLSDNPSWDQGWIGYHRVYWGWRLRSGVHLMKQIGGQNVSQMGQL